MKTNNTKPWLLRACLGTALLAFAIPADGVDVANNYAYGITWNTEAAIIMVIAALCVVVLPAAIGAGASWVLAPVAAVCIVATVYCADKAYNHGQAENVAAKASIHEQYATAQKRKARAEAALESIKETGDAETLARQANAADAIVKDAARKVDTDCLDNERSRRCKTAHEAKAAADAKAEQAGERLSNARARDKAQADLKAATDDQKAGDAPVPEQDKVLTWVLIGLTQAIASLGGIGAGLIHGALRDRPRRKVARKEPEAKLEAAPAADALAKVKALVKAGGGELRMSRRKLAEALGMPSSTVQDKLTTWHKAGALDVAVEGRCTVIRLADRRAA
jgi:hypothetical protein